MDIDERKELMTRFWSRVTKAIGLVPIRVMGLLDLFELSASQGIADTEMDWACHIETQVKARGDEMFQIAVNWGFTRSKYDVFGLEHNDVSTFSLLPAERICINNIRKLIQDNGIRSYIATPVRATRRREPCADQPNFLDVVPTSGQLKQMLLEKLAGYYRKRKNLGINGNLFADLSVVTVSESENQETVRVPCVKCNHRPTCSRNGTVWLANNYYQHVRIHLRKEAEVRSSRRSTGRVGRPGGPSRRASGVNTRSATEQRERVDEDAESGEDQSTLVDRDVERESQQSPSLTASSDPHAQSIPLDTDGDDDAQPDASSGVQRGSVADGTEEQAAGSGDGGCQPGRKKSVSELVQQFSGEGTSNRYKQGTEQSEQRCLRSREPSEN